MSWYIDNEFIKDEKGNVICILLSDVDPFHERLIKKSPDILDLIKEFVDTYAARRKMSKKLYDKFCAIIEENKDYNLKWRINKTGDIEDEEGIICKFPKKRTINAAIIKYVPEMLKTIQECINNFDSSNPKQKPVYERFCKIQDDIIEYYSCLEPSNAIELRDYQITGIADIVQSNAIGLRDYQITGIKDIENAWKNCRSVLFQMPTGTGKTTLFCEIVRKFTTELFPNKKVLIITHRRELVEQAFNRLVSDFHLTSGIISSTFIGVQSSPIQVASIQTLVRRAEHQKDLFSLVIIDEAHHALASTYKKLWAFYPSSKFLGVTATPIRTNGQGFQDLFDTLITSDSIKWFIKEKWLSDIRYFASHTPDVSNVKVVSTGDYDNTELGEIMQDNRVMADLVQSYKDFAPDKKIIVFAVNRAHCTKIVEKYNSEGFTAKSIDTYTSKDERTNIVNDFRNNKFKILCNVNIFTEGFDCPDVDAVQLARPTKSLTLFLQQVGRCMRPHEKKQDGIVLEKKQYGIILDNAGLWKEHGLPKMERNWSLNGTDKNICPSQKEIIGIKENTYRENNEPQESKGIRLVEVGELDNVILFNTINYSNIEKNLTDKKIHTMNERLEALIKKIQKFEKLKNNESDEEDKKIFDENINKFQKELFDLQEKLQPKRFEQVIELIIEKCQEMIDSNDIFVDGDKDIFLKNFIEPSLRSNNSKTIQENPSFIEGQIVVHHNRAGTTKLKVTFPNGKVVNENKAINTLIKTIQEFGIDKVKQLSIGGTPIVSDKAINGKLKKEYKQIPNTLFYINDNTSTRVKKDSIEKIAKMLGEEITVEIVNKQ